MLDGFGAGIFGAPFPAIVSVIPYGSGRFNLSQGAIAAAQGMGASRSAAIAGIIVVRAGCAAAFLALATIAVLGFALYLCARPETADRSPPPQ